MRRKVINAIDQRCSENGLAVPIREVYPLDQISQAHDDVEAKNTIGNVGLAT
tara:strand:+ start:587 stop:742 length:156 start_codon:yes stop_codon:yes gene_type:complete